MSFSIPAVERVSEATRLTSFDTNLEISDSIPRSLSEVDILEEWIRQRVKQGVNMREMSYELNKLKVHQGGGYLSGKK